MTLTIIPLPYGVREIKISPLDASGTVGTSVALPNAQTLQFAEAEDSDTLRGNDAVVAIHGKGSTVNWQLAGGGISFEAAKVLTSGTIATTGTTPNQVKTFKKTTNDVRQYFLIEGRAISDSGGDVHCIIYKAKSTGDVSGTMGDGSFFITGAQGTGIYDVTGNLYEFLQNETAVAVV